VLSVYLLLVSVFAHSTKYKVSDAPPRAGEAPPFFSYHAHILYLQNNANNTAEAMKLYERAKKQFGLVEHCTDMFHSPVRCYFYPDTKPAGPFVTAQWAVYFLPHEYGEFVTWFMQNRGEFDLMVHGNSGYELDDHTTWPLWGGSVWKIDGTIFHD